MGDLGNNATQSTEEDIAYDARNSTIRHDADSAAFHSQLEYLSQPGLQSPHNVSQYGQHPFDMGAMAGSLPQMGSSPMNVRNQYGPGDAPGILTPASVYQMQQASQYPVGRGMTMDHTSGYRTQQQHEFHPQYGSLPHQPSMAARQPYPMHAQGQYNQFDPYGYGFNAMQMPQVDPRYAAPGAYGMLPNISADMQHFSRRASEPAAIPSYPRGPPRKPKQSGHALWVGNLPPAATVVDLKDHFSRDATKDIESLFLISKSNCAFVNYRSEAACVAAMNRFHDSRFHGVRLVCRLRRGSAAGSQMSLNPTIDASRTPSSSNSPAGAPSPAESEEPTSPTIVGSSQLTTPSLMTSNTSGGSGASHKVTDKYFIVKSLTVQDLEASVRNQTWATQSHNEDTLNRAYEGAENVYLIFSANKSGEYFGYARMKSRIAGEPIVLSSSKADDELGAQGEPQSIPTAATETATRGRIIDDSARGTIFWEAIHSDQDEEDSPNNDKTEDSNGQNWGKQFEIEWMSTARLPFYRTRGLRNPYNANREIKIARDGTELEPSVGRRLVQMFTRPSPGGPPPQPNMLYP